MISFCTKHRHAGASGFAICFALFAPAVAGTSFVWQLRDAGVGLRWCPSDECWMLDRITSDAGEMVATEYVCGRGP